MDSFFSEYSQKKKMLDNILKQDLNVCERISRLMKIEVFNELIRQNI